MVRNGDHMLSGNQRTGSLPITFLIIFVGKELHWYITTKRSLSFVSWFVLNSQGKKLECSQIVKYQLIFSLKHTEDHNVNHYKILFTLKMQI